MDLWFWIVFGAQFLFWLFLSLTRPGKLISGLYAAVLTFVWALDIYRLIPSGPTTDIQAATASIGYITISGINLMLQLAIPAWMGLLAGTAITVRSEQDG